MPEQRQPDPNCSGSFLGRWPCQVANERNGPNNEDVSPSHTDEFIRLDTGLCVAEKERG
jgi:hypothetical protein